MVWFNCITAFRTILDDAASCANGRISLTLVPSNNALKLTKRAGPVTLSHAPLGPLCSLARAFKRENRMACEVALRCDRCGRKYRLRTGDFRYYAVPWQPAELPVWEGVSCSDQDGWCHRCRRPRPIEMIPRIEDVQEMRARLLEIGTTEEVAGVEAEIRWRRDRVSPPRCLWCGSAAVEAMVGKFRHPGCGGELVIVETPWLLNTCVAY